MQHKPLPYQWGKFWNNTIKPEKQAMFFHSICQCIRFQYVSRIKMYSGLTKIKTRRRTRLPPEKRKKCRPKTFRTAFSREPSFSQGHKTKTGNQKQQPKIRHSHESGNLEMKSSRHLSEMTEIERTGFPLLRE
ncbi:hypothetical protein [Neisseria meningitidis]|uniref:hypothetical protein n=1 Tax=Neisseria meningitidis TaxID=487 RepID=UPI00129DD122|nr:hypothetical protein [Neisseria meningitidis]